MILAALLLQAAEPAAAALERFSILVPVAGEPCERRQGDDILVCADALPSQSLPLPGEAVSTRPVPVNREVTGTGALAAAATPCAARVGGCQAGFDFLGAGTALIRGVQKLVAPGSCCEDAGEGTSPGLLLRDVAGGVGRAFAKKPDRSRREPIRLDDTSEGRLLP